MRRLPHVLPPLVLLSVLAVRVPAGEPSPTVEQTRAAIERAIGPLERGMAGAAERRTCFTCHNQAVPVFALAEARRRGFALDEENFERQLTHTFEHLKRGERNYLEGRGQGGRVLTAGYALWALEAGGRGSDDITAAVAGFLLQYQKDRDRWSHPGSRPPSSGSDFTTSYVALRGLSAYGTDEQRSQIEARTEEVGQWLLAAEAEDTEDRVFRLLSMEYLDADEVAIQKAVSGLLETQRGDGGWAQTSEMECDAYATATALSALLSAGQLPADHSAIRRGAKYLLDTQLDDGTWRVTTRAKGFQTYFESGFPHGKDQFISIAASAWATLALCQTLPMDAE